jgi:hypothetical protein
MRLSVASTAGCQPCQAAFSVKTVTVPANPGRWRSAVISVTREYTIAYGQHATRKRLSVTSTAGCQPCQPAFSAKTVTIPANPGRWRSVVISVTRECNNAYSQHTVRKCLSVIPTQVANPANECSPCDSDNLCQLSSRASCRSSILSPRAARL